MLFPPALSASAPVDHDSPCLSLWLPMLGCIYTVKHCQSVTHHDHVTEHELFHQFGVYNILPQKSCFWIQVKTGCSTLRMHPPSNWLVTIWQNDFLSLLGVATTTNHSGPKRLSRTVAHLLLVVDLPVRNDDDLFYYHPWRNNAVVVFGTLLSFLI